VVYQLLRRSILGRLQSGRERRLLHQSSYPTPLIERSGTNPSGFASTSFVEFPELIRVEIGSQIQDDSVGEAESMQDIIDETEYSICKELCNRLVLDPLCKIVNSHQQMSETS
jgi:hypothetical protein